MLVTTFRNLNSMHSMPFIHLDLVCESVCVCVYMHVCVLYVLCVYVHACVYVCVCACV